eukprot:6345971-Prorocentrum_lima.AAC.1
MQVHVCLTHTPLLQELSQDLLPRGRGHVIDSTHMKVAQWAGHVQMSIQKILKADATCVEAHNTLPQHAPER